ncbi:hypothetical protein SpCBS45565_g00267 [Spizellomyces sp. 'palustris']|nr:hypothetical protein SpCBS45565_g00267 [Spizellomyces sp. 'palustris']
MSQPIAKLYTGAEIPLIAFGTYGGGDDAATLAGATRAALEAGYRHFDLAEVYGNQAELGQVFSKAIADGVVKRSDLFITSKVWNTKHDPKHVEESCKKTLKDLQLDYLDLLLVHWPVSWKHTGEDLRVEGNSTPRDQNGNVITAPVPLHKTWAAFENLVDAGLVKHIGISNFPSVLILDLLTYARIRPAVNQVERHPYLAQNSLLQLVKDNGIHLSAYTPLGRPGKINNVSKEIIKEPVVEAIAKELKQQTGLVVNTGHVLLRWHIERGVSVLPKSSNPHRIKSNLQITSQIRLTEEQLKRIDNLDCGLRYNDLDLKTGTVRPGGRAIYEI